MERLITLQDADFDSHAPHTVDRSSFDKRTAARAVVFDDEAKVGLMYVSSEGYYKLPGGGIDKDEDTTTALIRELREELGCAALILCELGEILEYRDYWQMVQTSFCFLARVSGEKGQPELTELERSQGFQVTWQANIDTAITVLESQKPTGHEWLAYKLMQTRDITILKAAQKAVETSKLKLL